MQGKHTYSAQIKRKQSSGLRPLIVFCMISFLTLTMFLREGDTGILHSIRAGVTTVTSPVRMVGAVVVSPFTSISNVASNLTADDKTLSELKRENAELQAQVIELQEAGSDARRLEELLGLQSTYQLQSTAARINGASADAWSKTVTIDKGTLDGLTVNMPVTNSAGVIGQIVEVSPNSATVRLLTDENSGVSAMIQSTRAQGMLNGQPDGTLRLDYVPADALVQIDDLVITSGLGGVYPKGLPLGRVIAVDKADNALYYSIIVEPFAHAESFEEVLIITSLTQEQRATEEDVASANSNPSGGEPVKPKDDAEPSDEDTSTDDSSSE